MDPALDLFKKWSPYNYCLDNPIKFQDIDGSIPWNDLLEGRTYGPRVDGNGFGNRMHPIEHKIKHNNGIDLASTPENGKLKAGTHIFAAARGVVIGVAYDKIAGNFIKIDHGNGYVSVYCHIRDGDIFVEVGQTIDNGQIIAGAGTTGGSTGIHLHFGIKKDGKWIDPTSIPDLDEFLHSDNTDVLKTQDDNQNLMDFNLLSRFLNLFESSVAPDNSPPALDSDIPE